MNDFPFKVGSRVQCVLTGDIGVVTAVDLNCYPLYRYGVTTCEVTFGARPPQVVWTNRLYLIED